MKTLTIDPAILSKYPDVAIGYIVVDNLHYVSTSPNMQETEDQIMGLLAEKNIMLQNLADHQPIADWRRVYADCSVKPKTYKSSIESLLRRFIEKKYSSIIPSVDIYNRVSAESILSVGGYDFSKIEEGLTLRFAVDTDQFIPLSGKQDVPIQSTHIIYADECAADNVVCWMWNHKDSRRTMLSNEVKTALFIFDCISESDRSRLPMAQQQLIKLYEAQGALSTTSGVLDKNNRTVILNHTQI